jgi:DNA-binding GntR family transcriptional regulator
LRADGALARLIGCDELREWQHVSGIRQDAEGEPLAIVNLYVDPNRGRLVEPIEHDPVYEWLEATYGIQLSILSQDIRAKHLTSNEAEALGETAGSAVLQMIRRYFDVNDQMYMISVTTHRARDFVYNLRVQIKD